MAKHEHKINVEKHPDGHCQGCGNSRKTIAISTPQGTLELCHKCLSWLKGKLMGF